jgi:hypothetical protein
MQPYQEASEEIQRQGKRPGKVLGSAAAIGLSAVGAGIGARVFPFLSKHIPLDLMRKGLNKIDPRLGKFADSAVGHGFSLDDVRQFLSGKFPTQTENDSDKNPTEKNPQHNNPLNDFESNYPDVAQALANIMKNGQPPDAAAAILKQTKSFSNSIKKLEGDIGKNFVDYVLELFGPQLSGKRGEDQTNSQPAQDLQQNQAPQQGVDHQLLNLIQGLRTSLKGMQGG